MIQSGDLALCKNACAPGIFDAALDAHYRTVALVRTLLERTYGEWFLVNPHSIGYYRLRISQSLTNWQSLFRSNGVATRSLSFWQPFGALAARAGLALVTAVHIHKIPATERDSTAARGGARAVVR